MYGISDLRRSRKMIANCVVRLMADYASVDIELPERLFSIVMHAFEGSGGDQYPFIADKKNKKRCSKKLRCEFSFSMKTSLKKLSHQKIELRRPVGNRGHFLKKMTVRSVRLQ